MSLDTFLRAVCSALRDAGIPFMLTGSVATAYHGSSRATMDVDFVIDPTTTQLVTFVDRIAATGAYVSSEAAQEALADRTMFNVVDPLSGWKADMIVRKDRPFSHTELDRRESADYFGIAIEVASLEDVILSKLEWAKLGGSARQLDDVRSLLRFRSDAVDREYLERWLDTLGVRAQWNAVNGGSLDRLPPAP